MVPEISAILAKTLLKTYARNQYTIESGLFLLLSYGILLLSFLSVGASYDTSPEVWFQCSGSLVVCLAIFAEIRLFGLINIHKSKENSQRMKSKGNNSFINSIRMANANRQSKNETFYKWHTHFFIIRNSYLGVWRFDL